MRKKIIRLAVLIGMAILISTCSDYGLGVDSSSALDTLWMKAFLANGISYTTLTTNTWADGNITSSISGQVFKFTATASTQYIHVSFGTLSSSSSYGLYIQVYDSSGNTVGSGSHLYVVDGGYNSRVYYSHYDIYTSNSVTSGQEYYIKVKPYSSSSTGTYKIAFNESSSSIPPSNVTLTANTWADGNLSQNGEQWFKFTATAPGQYILVSFGTLSSSSGLYIQVYNSSGNTVESGQHLYNYNTYTYTTVSSGQEYYIKVTPSYSSYGTYQIMFSSTPPTPTLTANTWADGNLTSSNNYAQWFKFTATASTQYIHVSFGTLSSSSSYGLYIQVYDSSGNTVGSSQHLYNYYNTYTYTTVSSGQEYYIKVTPYSSNYGTYKIAFNTSSTPPS